MEVRQTATFTRWLSGLRDPVARARVVVRIRRLQTGNFGDVKPVGGRISELRVDHGPGYRIYFMTSDRTVVILLCGGDKRTQRADIARARLLAEELEDGR